MRFVFLFFLLSEITFGQSVNQLVISYNDSATRIVSKTKDYVKAIALLDKAIQIDSTYHRSYENKFPYLMALHRYDDAEETNNRLIKLSSNNALYISMAGLLLENKGDIALATIKYTEAENKFKAILEHTQPSGFKYEFMLVNRAMNLLFLRQDSTAKQICVEYAEKYKKEHSKEWLNRILKLTRKY